MSATGHVERRRRETEPEPRHLHDPGTPNRACPFPGEAPESMRDMFSIPSLRSSVRQSKRPGFYELCRSRPLLVISSERWVPTSLHSGSIPTAVGATVGAVGTVGGRRPTDSAPLPSPSTAHPRVRLQIVYSIVFISEPCFSRQLFRMLNDRVRQPVASLTQCQEERSHSLYPSQFLRPKQHPNHARYGAI